MARWRISALLLVMFGIAACGSDEMGDDDEQRGDQDNVGVTDENQTGGDSILPGDSDGGDGSGGDGSGGDGSGGDGDVDGGDTVGGGDDEPYTPIVTSIIALSATTQSASAGGLVTAPPRVEVRDQQNVAMAGQTVRFSVVGGDGTIAPTTDVVTNAAGQAELTSWRLGKSAVPQSVRASLPSHGSAATAQFDATVSTAFGIELIYLSAVTPAQEAAFASAAARWRAVVVSEHQDFLYNRDQLDPSCGRIPGDTTTRQGDDLVIFAGVTDIEDTPESNVLANAGPCYVRGDGTTQIGIMNFDVDDIDQLEADGLFEETVLHEMGHVIGVGTYWKLLDLIDDPSAPDCSVENPGPGNPGVNTVFTGPLAFEAFEDIGGTGSPAGVPADNSAQCGSADSHWRESVFTNELMSPSLAQDDVSLPLSVVTIASIADMQLYQVNFDAADPFSLAPGLRFESSAPVLDNWCVPRRPLASGVLRPVP